MRARKEDRNVPAAVERELGRLIPAWPDAARLCVALSGGVDSVALLAACARLRMRHPAVRLRAIHVHHGLQPEADDWQRRCEDLCLRLDVSLEIVRLDLAPRRGESVEAAARDARYAALAARLAPGEALLTAHHEDDQLETVLLQLCRGAGVAGLAAMPARAALGPGLHLRPMLGLGRDSIHGFARAIGLAWVDDPMNDAPRFDRGYLRRQVTPALRARWPAVARSVGRAAGHLAEAQCLLDDLAELDSREALDGDRLRVDRLRALARPRQANLLRWWLRQRGLGLPSTARLGTILDGVLRARPDRLPVVSWPTGEVRRYRGLLYAMWPLGSPPEGWEHSIRPGGTVRLPGGFGRVSLPRCGEDRLGVDPATTPLVIRLGAGCDTGPGIAAMLRASAIEPWWRSRTPLLFAGGQLLAAADARLDCRIRGAAAPLLRWVRDRPPPAHAGARPARRSARRH
jgi:tRNA(Ile)-lysidine synthase